MAYINILRLLIKFSLLKLPKISIKRVHFYVKIQHIQHVPKFTLLLRKLLRNVIRFKNHFKSVKTCFCVLAFRFRAFQRCVHEFYCCRYVVVCCRKVDTHSITTFQASIGRRDETAQPLPSHDHLISRHAVFRCGE